MACLLLCDARMSFEPMKRLARGCAPQQHEIWRLLLHNFSDSFCDRQRLDNVFVRGFDVNGVVGTHGHSSSEDVGCFRRADGQDGDLFYAVFVLFSQSDGFFDSCSVPQIRYKLDHVLAPAESLDLHLPISSKGF